MAESRRGTKFKRTKQTKDREFKIVGTGTNVKRKQKAGWGKKGSGNAIQGKGLCLRMEHRVLSLSL